MPIILEWTYKDGTKEIERIPAQVWRKNEKKVIKTFMKDKEVASVKLDPYKETADIDTKLIILMAILKSQVNSNCLSKNKIATSGARHQPDAKGNRRKKHSDKTNIYLLYKIATGSIQ